ncbi:MAG: ABC transporter permease subunit, partial [Pseudomonadota bacterium]
TVFPSIYAQIRLPVYVVLAYSMSVVDVALILGPNTPPTLSVQIVRWMSDPDLALRLQAAAGAVAQFGLVLGALTFWWLCERLAGALGHRVVWNGRRGHFDRVLRRLGLLIGVVSTALVLAGLLGLAVWSVAGFWTYPDALPNGLTLRSWMRHGPGLWDALIETTLIASWATALALILTLGCLETEQRRGLRMGWWGFVILYLPLLVPQTAFLPGLQALLLSTGAENGRGPVIAAHLVFVLPYVFLSLADPFRAWDPRYGTIAKALGAGPDRILWRVRLPMLLRPILTAFAVGFAVSVGQYLPTLLIGGGRVQTLTTEALALAAGGDRRAIGVYSLAQTLAALLPFAAAILIPAVVWRHRRGLRHA